MFGVGGVGRGVDPPCARKGQAARIKRHAGRAVSSLASGGFSFHDRPAPVGGLLLGSSERSSFPLAVEYMPGSRRSCPSARC